MSTGYGGKEDVCHIGGLPLPPQAGVGLLVEFQRPGQPKPYESGAACLQVQTVTGRSWVDERHGQLAAVPSADAVGIIKQAERDVPFVEPLGDALQVVLEPVSHQNRFAVGGFDEVLQGIQLAVVYLKYAFVLSIDGPVCHLGELVRKGCGVSGINLLIAQGNDQFRAHGIVSFPLLLGKHDLHLVHHTFWHLQVVCRLHGDSDVGDGIVDLFLRTGQRFVAEHHLPVALVRLEESVAVMGDEPTEPLAHIEDAELCPEIHKTVAAWRAGQPNDAFDSRMYQLIIAEKPSVAQSIAAVLGAKRRETGYLEGGGYLVSWCFGHLAELASAETYNEAYAKWRYDDLPIVPFSWRWKISRDKWTQFEILKTLLHREDVGSVINACDAGREGELIFRTVYCMAGCTKPMQRLWISSMEDDAIRSGFQNLRPGSDYDGLHQSALCRAKADWLVGINATRLFSVLYHRTLNVGRVLSPTLALLVQREAEIGAFRAEPFYTVQLDCGGVSAVSEKFKDKAAAMQLADACANQTAVVKCVEQKERTEKPPALYDLTTLQRDANRILGYTAQQTLDYLQALYEKKLCTYPRTDARYLTDDMQSSVASYVAVAAELCETPQPEAIHAEQVCNSKKVSDHHALLPTASATKAAFLDLPLGEREVLRLVAKQLLCAVSDAHR